MSQQVIIGVGADTRAFDASLQRSLSRLAQPLGKITGSASDFDKSLAASNARVLAFGASAASIYSIKRAFDFTVVSMIDVEKALTDINVLLKLSSSQLDLFGSGLFSVANNTASTFKEAAKAAAEFSRQGLGVNEILERTEAAMGLSRLSGLDLAESISAVTAAMNTFNKEGLNSTLLVDKLASVDAAFAVSSADLAQAIKRVGSVAEDSNVSLDQMLALTAATQQKTARGGAIIGNAFKTIFTRLNRPEVLNQLEQLGITTRDVTGQIRPLMDIMEELAKRYDKLAPAAKSTTSELLGGVFQINILKASMADLGSEFSIYRQALNASEKATGDFSKRNEELNKTLSARIAQTLNNATQLAEKIGTITIKPTLSSGVNMFGSWLKELNDTLSVKETVGSDGGIKKEYLGLGGELGHEVVKGIFGAIGGMLSGPLVQILAVISTKLAVGFVNFTMESGKSLLGLESKAQNYKKALEQTQLVLANHPELLQQISSGTRSVRDVQSQILHLLELQTAHMKAQKALAEGTASIKAGYVSHQGETPPSMLSQTGSSVLGGMKKVVNRLGFAAGTRLTQDEMDFILEEQRAKSLGASKNVKAKWSKGTINGKRFILNSEEDEFPGKGINGNSIVAPRYMRGAAAGFANGYAGGDMLGMSLMLGVLAGFRDNDKIKSKEISNVENELGKLAEVLKETQSSLKESYQKRKKDFGDSVVKTDRIREKGEDAKSQWRNFYQDALKQELSEIEEARRVSLKQVNVGAGMLKSRKNDVMMNDTRLSLAEKRNLTTIPKLQQAKKVAESRHVERIGSISSSGLNEDIQSKLQGEQNLKEIESAFEQSEGRLKLQIQKKQDNLSGTGKDFDRRIKEAQSQLTSIKKGGNLAGPWVKQTPEIKQKIADKKTEIEKLKADKSQVISSGNSEISNFTQKEFEKLQERKFKALNDEVVRQQGESNKIKQKTQETLKKESESHSKKQKIIDAQIQKENDSLDAVRKKALFSRQDFEITAKQYRANVASINEEFKEKKRLAKQSASKRTQSKASEIDQQVEGAADSIRIGDNISQSDYERQRAETIQKRLEAIRKRKVSQKLKEEIEAREKQESLKEQNTQSKAFKYSIISSAVAGSGVITKALGEGPGGKSAQDMAENFSAAAQIVSAFPNQFGLLAAGVVLTTKSIYDIAANIDAKTFDKMSADFEIMKQSSSVISGRLNEYSNLIGTLTSSYGDANISTKNLVEMQNKASKIFSDLPSEIRGKLLSASSDKEKQDIISSYQTSQEKKKESLGENLNIESKFHEANKSNLIFDMFDPIGNAVDLITGRNAPRLFKTSGVFDTRGFFGPSEGDKMKDEADAKAYASYVNSNMSSSDTKKALGVLEASKGKSSSEKVMAFAGAGIIDSNAAAKIAQSPDGSNRFIKNLEEQVIASESARLAQGALTEKSKEYQKQLFYINKRLEIARETSKSVYTSMNADVTSYVSRLVSAASNLTKLSNAKRTAQIEEIQGQEDLYAMQYGASTMNSIKFAGKRQQLLTETGNKKNEMETKASADIVGVVMSKVLSSSNSIFKNTDDSNNVSEEALYAKASLAGLVQKAMNSGNNTPETIFKSIQNSINEIPLNSKLGSNIKDANGQNYTEAQIAGDAALQKKRQESIKMANDAMKLELQSAFANGNGNAEQKAILDTLRAQLDAENTNSKIQLDALNRQEQQQQRLIDMQKNSKLFGGLPTSKQEQKDLEKDIKRTSAKAAKGDIYAQNKLLKMASETFDDDLKESSVKGLKKGVVSGEVNRIQKMVGLFGKSGLITGLPQQYDLKRIKQIAQDKVNTTLKTEKDKGFNAEDFVGKSLDPALVKSNQDLKASLDKLEATLTTTLSGTNPVIPEKAAANAVEEQKKLKAAEIAAKKQTEDIKKQREVEIKGIQAAFTESLKNGLKVSTDGKISFEIKGADGLSNDVVLAIKNGLSEIVKEQVGVALGARAADPTKVTRLSN
jgi:TP901 family phage tail tape measure protein